MLQTKQIKYNKNTYIGFEKYKHTKLENKIKIYSKTHFYIYAHYLKETIKLLHLTTALVVIHV